MRVLAALAVLLFAFLPLSTGCGSGRVANVSGDYRDHIKPARWDKGVVRYRIRGGPPIGASLVRRTIQEGISRWDKTFEGILEIREATGLEEEDITIKFVKVGDLGGDWFGHQTLGRDETPVEGRHWRTEPVITDGIFQSVVVKLDSQLWVRPLDLLRLSADEVGFHGLYGNEGHSPFPEDLGYSSPTATFPNQRDTNTAWWVYGKIP